MDECVTWAADRAESLQVDDYSVLLYLDDQAQARFSNNSLTVVNKLLTKELVVYISKGRKRIVGSLSTMNRESVEGFIERLHASMMAGGGESQFPRLPKGPFKYSYNGDFDPSVADLDLADMSSRAVDAALEAGAKRVAGSLTAGVSTVWIKTSTGAEASEERSRCLLNVRAFTDRDASGHGLSVATTLKEFSPEEAGKVAGENSRAARHPEEVEEGDYSVIFGPTVAANLIQHVGQATSAFNVDAGLSFFAGQLGKKVAVDGFNLVDHGQVRNGVHSRSFDDEGVPTRSNVLIEGGVLKTYIHNSATAAKHGAEPTGNAGMIEPRLWNLEVGEGTYTLDEMIEETKRGIYVTNNWYTRFQSYATGEYSTLPRDAAWLVEGGALKHPVVGLRINGAIPRQLTSIDAIGRERKWVQWWEVEVPTLMPAIRVPSVRITKATG